MSDNSSGTHNSISDSGSDAGVDAAAAHIAVPVADGSGECQSCSRADAESALSDSAKAQQQSGSDSIPSDMGHMPGSVNDSLLAADCLTDAGGRSSVPACM